MKTEYLKEQMERYRPFPLLLKFAIPAVLAQLFNAMYNLVDRMFIGHMQEEGSLALGGLGICFPIISLVTAFSWLVGMGGAPLLSISIGEGKRKEAEEIQNTSFLILILIGVLLTGSCYWFAKPILLLFGASEILLPYAVAYLKTYVLGSTAVMISMGMNSFINAQGRTIYGTATIVIGAVLNIILDYVFIYLLHMGIFGAALATVISQLVSASWVLWLLFVSDKLDIRMSIGSLGLKSRHIRRIFGLGFSSFVFMANESLVQVVLNRLLRSYVGFGSTGDLYIGSLTIIVSMSQLLFMPLQGITQGMQPIIGYCKGARKFETMKEVIRDAKILGISVAAVFWLLFLLTPGWVASLFTSDTQLIELSKLTLRLSFWECILFGFQMVNQHTFVAVGNARYSFFFAILRKILLLIPLACLLPIVLGVNGVFLAESVATVITVIVTQITFTRYMGKLEQEGK